MVTEIHQYIKNRKGQKVGVMYARKNEDGNIEIGHSVANEKAGDKFRKDRGFGMAKARAAKHGKSVKRKLDGHKAQAIKDQETMIYREAISKNEKPPVVTPSKIKRVSDQVLIAASGYTNEIVVGPGHKRQLDTFISRCERYFKGDKVYAQTISQADMLKDGEACKITKIFGGDCEMPEVSVVSEEILLKEKK